MEKFPANSGFDETIDVEAEESAEDSGDIRELAKALLSHPDMRPMESGMEDLRNGTVLRAETDNPDTGFERGTVIPVMFDGKYIRFGSMDGQTYWVEKLVKEVEQGKWTIVGQLDEEEK